MEKEPIRVAVVSGSKAVGAQLAKALGRFSTVEIVYQGISLQTHFKELKKQIPK